MRTPTEDGQAIDKANVSEHIKHIFDEGELEGIGSCSEYPNNCGNGKNINLLKVGGNKDV